MAGSPHGAAALALALAVALLVAGQTAAHQAPPKLGPPLACTVGRDCFVQTYVDVDPGAGARDHTCGSLTRDGHTGTDIRLVDLGAMRRGVSVVAAAAGTVLTRRDGMADAGLSAATREAIKGRECGNGVVVDLGGGWHTQYCHLRKGSISVVKGERVAAGQRLGQVGLSGQTAFPHLHFELRHHDKVIDPYVGEGGEGGCGGVARPLWNPAAAQALAYRAGGLLAAGFTATVPKLAEIKEGRHRNERLEAYGQVLVFWSYIFGLRRGDVMELRLFGPDGRMMATNRGELAAKNQAVTMRYLGKRRAQEGWPPGIYRGSYRLLRGGKVVVEASREVELR
jgi:hypothetical protein